jgi:NAD(P)-dependent dehydrogenase (short-subunit alcohol dehydrogenase family)
MSHDFSDQVVLITGAGQGVGAALARGFAAAGAAVALVGRTAAKVERVAAPLPRAVAIRADITRPGEVKAAFAATRDAFGPVTVLVNNAMTCSESAYLDVTEAEYDSDVDTSLKGPFLAGQAAIPEMIAAGCGAILNVSSVNALEYLGDEAYSAAKAGLISLTRSVAVRYGRAGIRANALVLGTIITESWDARLAEDPGVLDNALRFYPSPRLGTTDDVVAAALFLASEGAGWINGASLVIDGGLTAGNLAMAFDIGPTGEQA